MRACVPAHVSEGESEGGSEWCGWLASWLADVPKDKLID